MAMFEVGTKIVVNNNDYGIGYHSITNCKGLTGTITYADEIQVMAEFEMNIDGHDGANDVEKIYPKLLTNCWYMHNQRILDNFDIFEKQKEYKVELL